MIDRRNATRVSPPKPMRAKLKTSLSGRVLDISLRGLQVELDHSLPLRARCDLHLQMEDGEVVLKAIAKRCSVQGWTERQGRKVLLYRAGLEFETPSREVLKILGPKIPLLLEKSQPADAESATTAGIEVIIEEP